MLSLSATQAPQPTFCEISISPFSGSQINPDWDNPYRHKRRRLRVLIHRDYLVFYRERPGVIELVRILHGRQNIPDILDDL